MFRFKSSSRLRNDLITTDSIVPFPPGGLHKNITCKRLTNHAHPFYQAKSYKDLLKDTKGRECHFMALRCFAASAQVTPYY